MYRIALVVGSLVFMVAAWVFGYTKGAAEVRAQWEAERQLTQQAQANLEAAYESLAQDHAEQSLMVEQELKNARVQHEKTVAAIRSDYDNRLRQQERRIADYTQVATSGSTGCRAVASRAAELDRHLGEGIELVEEFAAVVGFRDATIRAMSQQIKAERDLLQRMSQ